MWFWFILMFHVNYLVFKHLVTKLETAFDIVFHKFIGFNFSNIEISISTAKIEKQMKLTGLNCHFGSRPKQDFVVASTFHTVSSGSTKTSNCNSSVSVWSLKLKIIYDAISD